MESEHDIINVDGFFEVESITSVTGDDIEIC